MSGTRERSHAFRGEDTSDYVAGVLRALPNWATRRNVLTLNLKTALTWICTCRLFAVHAKPFAAVQQPGEQARCCSVLPHESGP